MNDPLTIQALLKKLDKTKINPEILARCREAEDASYRRNFQQANSINDVAIKMAAKANPASKASILGESIRRTSVGIAWLYQAAICAYSTNTAEREKAELDIETALTWLNLDDHHRVIARLIQAVIVLNNSKRESAINHYLDARSLLEDLIDESHRTGKRELEAEYARLCRVLDEKVNRLSTGEPNQSSRQISHRTPVSQESLVTHQFATAPSQHQNEQPPVALPIPTELIWPEPEPLGIRISSNSDSREVLANQDTGINEQEYLEVSQLALFGKKYAIQDIQTNRRVLRLQINQRYIPLQIAPTVALQDQSGAEAGYVLVKQQDDINQPGQLLTIVKPDAKRGWVVRDGVESVSSQQYPKIIGERHWQLTDESGVVDYSEKEIHIIGVVVALLTLVKPASISNIKEVFPIGPHISPIVPGETVFNPREGHVVVDCESDHNVAEGVIMRVLSDARASLGKAEVIVNRHNC